MIIEDIKINADTEEGNHLIVTGRSLESILERRIIWGQRIFNGNLQNGIQTMLNECIISPSIADRKISNFVFVPSADPKITSLKIDSGPGRRRKGHEFRKKQGASLHYKQNHLCRRSGGGRREGRDDGARLVPEES